MRYFIAIVLLLAACGTDKKRDSCGNNPNCLPVTIGGSMTVACRCYPHPVRQVQESP